MGPSNSLFLKFQAAFGMMLLRLVGQIRGMMDEAVVSRREMGGECGCVRYRSIRT